MFLHERCFFRHWREMALEHVNFYGDTGAFINPVRVRFLREFLREPALLAKVLYASDIPARPLAWSCLLRIGLARTRALCREENPFNLSVRAYRELGFQDDFFSRGWELLRIPRKKKESTI